MTAKPKFTIQQEQIAKIAKALSHPARVYILEKLNGLNACCTSGEMIGDIPIARSTLSQHLKELKYAGLIQGEIEPPMIKYCINRNNWETAKILMLEFLK
ncbi:MAG: helix-turn-helix transcriptional regulator [Bacteroidetes bacterium]|nr:helix-turn-helix transcriptional regulator [Bacteroidota bacterium]